MVKMKKGNIYCCDVIDVFGLTRNIQAIYAGQANNGSHIFIRRNNGQKISNPTVLNRTGEHVSLYSRTTKDGFLFIVYKDGKKIRVTAGCRDYTVRQAERHWGKETTYWLGSNKLNQYGEMASGEYSVAEYNKLAVKREKINQQRLDFLAEGVAKVERASK